MYNSRRYTVAQIAEMFRVSRQTIYRHLGAERRFNVTPAAAGGIAAVEMHAPGPAG